MRVNAKFFILFGVLLIALPGLLTACSKKDTESAKGIQASSISSATAKAKIDGPTDKLDGTNMDTFESSMETMANKLTDTQKAAIDHAFELLGDEFTDQSNLQDAPEGGVSYNLNQEVLKKVDGKTYGEIIGVAENYLQTNVGYKKREISNQINDLLLKAKANPLEDKDQRKLAYLHEQLTKWEAIKPTISDFDYEESATLVGANLSERTQGRKQKISGYEPYELEPDKYRDLYKQRYPQ